MVALALGTVAPDFTLRNQRGEEVTLSGARGKKVVLMFYPFAFTRTCTSELCSLRDRNADFANDDAEVWSVSCDSPATLKAFADSEGLTHQLLSDFWPHGDVSRAYDAFIDKIGCSSRVTYVIDREGIIRWSAQSGMGEARDDREYVVALGSID